MTSLQRLKQLLPSWFGGPISQTSGSSTPVLDAVLGGIGTALDNFNALMSYIKLQMRIATATDGFLDLIAGDYYGGNLPRLPNETDASYRARILSNLFTPVVTRSAILKGLLILTGRAATIFEPGRPADTGGYNLGGVGYGIAGGWGSMIMPGQFFIYPKRPMTTGIPNVIGYGAAPGAYATPSQIEYASPSMFQQGVADSAIYALIDKLKGAGCTAWTQISN